MLAGQPHVLETVVRNAKAPVARYGRAAASHASQPPSSVGEKYHAAANDRRRCASVAQTAFVTAFAACPLQA